MDPNRRLFFRLCGGALVSNVLPTPAINLSARGYPVPSRPISAVQKAIIDTDPGVDDAFALLLALRSPEVQVEAITAVAGNVPLSLTLPNALRLVEIAGRSDVPVAGGASSPLVRKLVDASYAHGNNGLAGVSFPAPRIEPVKDRAADLICRMVRANAGAISIIGIGPLTNIALALREDPEIASMIHSIVLMGGSLSGGNVTPAAEFNFYVDPEAASIVFGSGIPIRMVGLDVTRQVELTQRHIEKLQAASGPVSEAAVRIGNSALQMQRAASSAGRMHLHDPLAVSCLIDPDIVTFEDYHVAIETSGTITAGESVGWKHSPVSYSAPLQTADSTPVRPFVVNASVATGVDSEKFFELLISRLTQEHS
jgi:inosine-uridine nucleoside N-ribohydrolase